MIRTTSGVPLSFFQTNSRSLEILNHLLNNFDCVNEQGIFTIALLTFRAVFKVLSYSCLIKYSASFVILQLSSIKINIVTNANIQTIIALSILPID